MNTATKSKEYLAGYDCGVNGSNETNCNFTLFSTPEKTKEWEQGKKDAAASLQPKEEKDFQDKVHSWLLACFGEKISNDRVERNHRFLEEALELVQSLGCTKSEADQLTNYVFNREKGEPTQEVGGVIVCLAALCSANEFDMNNCGETELSRIWTKIDKIRQKQADKPTHSPLPVKEEDTAAGEDKLWEEVLPKMLQWCANYIEVDGHEQTISEHVISELKKQFTITRKK